LTRLVHADWLEEHGEVEQAEFLRLECLLAQISDKDLRHPQARARLAELCRRLETAWLETHGKKYDVILESFPPEITIYVIKSVREVVGLGLREAKECVESHRRRIAQKLSWPVAENVKSRFLEAVQCGTTRANQVSVVVVPATQ
jgi:ribosomal protein L7/L12